MKPEIKFNKVIVDDERAYKVISINGVKHFDDLPNAYISDGLRFSMNDRVFSIISFPINVNFVIGDVIDEAEFAELKHQMKRAAMRLKEINKKIAADADGWEGTASIALEE
ncbi:MAG: hypothetical protein KAJ03_01820 [Gammaproteobacteria bacterium]|nr:hypothetical protein [Gammaproteobacteria bacterium]